MTHRSEKVDYLKELKVLVTKDTGHLDSPPVNWPDKIKVLDEWSSHLSQSKSLLNEWSHIDKSDHTKHNRQISLTELTITVRETT